MRIVSLVPSATEMLFALGLGDEVIAVTHECDYPTCGPGAAEGHARRAARRPHRRADRRGRARPNASRARRSTSSTRRRCTSCEPDLIVTQALCAVCAVSFDDVRAVAERARLAARGDLARPAARSARCSATCARSREATGRRDAGVALIAGRRRAHRPRAPRGARPTPAARRRARVARAGLRRRPLDAAADRVRGRARRARNAGRALASGARGRRWRPRSPTSCRDAVRLRRRARACRGADVPRAAGGARRRRGRRRRRRRVLLPSRPAADRRARAARASAASRRGAGSCGRDERSPSSSDWRAASPGRAGTGTFTIDV